jgi:hypothetical protein
MHKFIKITLISFMVFLCPKALFAQSVDAPGSLDSNSAWDSTNVQYPVAYQLVPGIYMATVNFDDGEIETVKVLKQ